MSKFYCILTADIILQNKENIKTNYFILETCLMFNTTMFNMFFLCVINKTLMLNVFFHTFSLVPWFEKFENPVYILTNS